MQIQENAPLSFYTTFHIGGPARFLMSVHSVDEVREALAFAHEKNLPAFVLGGGSNTLAPDEEFDGVVVKVELLGIERQEDTIIAAAGEAWDSVVAYAVGQGLWGIENLSGIPGSVGGAVVGNIGAYGQALSQTLAWVEVLDVDTGEVQRKENPECKFGYRDSVFKHDDGQHIVLRAAFALSREPNPELSYHDPNRAYKDIARVLRNNHQPSIRDIRSAIVEIRLDKFPNIEKEGTAGSFFKNPILPEQEVQKLAATYPGLPIFPMPEIPGNTKVSMAWLLDHVLHMHGTHVGGARLFENQVLVIAAGNDATARDVKELASSVAKKVFDELKIKIEPEVKIL